MGTGEVAAQMVPDEAATVEAAVVAEANEAAAEAENPPSRTGAPSTAQSLTVKPTKCVTAISAMVLLRGTVSTPPPVHGRTK